MANYTDEQIKRALKQMSEEYPDNFSSYVLDFINRQEAEIEKLKEKNRLACRCTPKAIRRAKSEAIKEVAESIKSYIDAYVVFEKVSTEERLLEYIDSLVKEKVGENNV